MSESLQSLVKLQLKRGSNNTFDIRNFTGYVLAYGEPFYDATTGNLYVGDGSTALASLTPINGIKSVEITENDISNTRVVTGVAVDKTKLLVNKGFNALSENKIGYVDIMSAPYTIGGISQGDNLSELTIIQILNKLLAGNYTRLSNLVFELIYTESGSQVSVSGVRNISYSGGSNINSFKVGVVGASEYLIDDTSLDTSQEYLFTTPVIGERVSISMEISDGTSRTSNVVTVASNSVIMYYGGVQNISNIDSTIVNDLIRVVETSSTSSDKSFSFPEVEEFINFYPVFVYPQSMGELQRIYVDDISYPEISGFAKKLITVNSISCWCYYKTAFVTQGPSTGILTYHLGW